MVKTFASAVSTDDAQYYTRADLSDTAAIKIAFSREALNNELFIEAENSKKKSLEFCQN